jgi:hypothetical protein
MGWLLSQRTCRFKTEIDTGRHELTHDASTATRAAAAWGAVVVLALLAKVTVVQQLERTNQFFRFSFLLYINRGS